MHTAKRCHNKARSREAHSGWGRRGQGNPSGVQQTARHNPGCANGGVNQANRVALFNPVGVGGLLATGTWGARARPQALMWHAAGVRAAGAVAARESFPQCGTARNSSVIQSTSQGILGSLTLSLGTKRIVVVSGRARALRSVNAYSTQKPARSRRSANACSPSHSPEVVAATTSQYPTANSGLFTGLRFDVLRRTIGRQNVPQFAINNLVVKRSSCLFIAQNV
ncbi:hypothetical protein TBK1r_53010 [Stieleria magnilauensis]|uniref:Uncharacterized protein n=1 Tax=Stieleria magnilauensis TaxID=2527963 RepID=A0ABX5XXL3_9BACT|nr:hypothetical protein TBK1r_53010 [Planctomycetes bacterium TBK1r]